MALRVDAGVLVALAVVLAWPAPAALARAGWTARSPRAALVLWQAVGLGGGLSILGAGLTLAAASLSDSWLGGMAALPTSWSRLGPLGWAGVALTATMGLWLIAVTAASGARVVVARRAHRGRLDAVGGILDRSPGGSPAPADRIRQMATAAVGSLPGPPSRGEPRGVRRLTGRARPCPGSVLAGVQVLDHRTAVAYCIPGLRPRIVVSSGVLKALEAEELTAVLAHERAHVRGHHDLVVQPFVAWQQAFPFLPAAGAALAAVDLLVEMLADDTARQSCPPRCLRAALAELAAGRPDDHHLRAQIAVRRARLVAPRRPLCFPALLLVYLAAAALVLGPPAVLLLS